jgi:pentatricopeptide repeat protein
MSHAVLSMLLLAQAGLQPAALTYRSLIRLLATNERVTEAGVELYWKMRRQKISPDQTTVMALLRGLARDRDADNASKVALDVIELQEYVRHVAVRTHASGRTAD